MTGNAFINAARAGKTDFWRYLLTIILVVFLVISGGVCLSLVGIVASGTPDLSGLPGYVFLAMNLLSFTFIPLGLWLGLRLLHKRPFLSIVNPDLRFDFRRFFFGAGVWLALVAASDLILAALNPTNYVWTFNPARFLPYLIVGLLLVPLQAGAEELLFRGYLTQGFGLISYWLGWLLPGIFFGTLHIANPEVAEYGPLLTMPIYIGLGLLLGWVTLRTRSLEIALGAHIINNLYSALLVTFPSSALETEVLFTMQTYDPLVGLVTFLILALIFAAVVEIAARRLLRRSAVTAFILVMIVPLVVSACGVLPQARNEDEATLPLEECVLTLPGSTLRVDAECGQLEVPENRADPQSRMISLNIAVIRAVTRNAEPDPVFLLAGGPGQAATEAFLPLINSLQSVRQNRDLVMVDQRGTGKSNPLTCLGDDTGAEALEVIGAQIALDEAIEEFEACLAELEDVDLTQYTTDVAMQDLDEVRQALGYDQINLLGVSYGTRAALTYLRMFPDYVRTVVLDGVVPPDWPLGISMREDSQRALDLILERCANEPGCSQAFPNLKNEFFDLMETLEVSPQEVTIPNPVTGEPVRVAVTPQTVGAVVRLMSYTDSQVALLPLMIHAAAQGDYAMLASQYVLTLGSLGESISYGMYYSVWCNEDHPLLPPEGELGMYFLEVDAELSNAVCELWPRREEPVPISAPARTDVPMLLISGEVDPVTPPENGEEVAEMFPNSLHLVVPGLGHNNFYIGCIPGQVRQFIEAGSVEGISPYCIQDIQPLPFFLSPVGPNLPEGTEQP